MTHFSEDPFFNLYRSYVCAQNEAFNMMAAVKHDKNKREGNDSVQASLSPFNPENKHASIIYFQAKTFVPLGLDFPSLSPSHLARRLLLY